jgi:hypothetical protein
MNSVIDRWLKSDGWTGIAARVVCELLFLTFILNAVHLAAWAEKLISGRTLIVDEKKALFIQQVTVLMVCVGLLVEVFNVLKLLVRKHHERKEAIKNHRV